MSNKLVKTSVDIVRCVLFSLIISVFAVLIMALIIRFANVGANVVMYMNQGVKIVSILAGIMLGMKDKKMGMIKGAVAGLVYILVSYLVFMLLASGMFNLSVWDVLMGLVFGLISGVLSVNMKKKK